MDTDVKFRELNASLFKINTGFSCCPLKSILVLMFHPIAAFQVFTSFEYSPLESLKLV